MLVHVFLSYHPFLTISHNTLCIQHFLNGNAYSREVHLRGDDAKQSSKDNFSRGCVNIYVNPFVCLFVVEDEIFFQGGSQRVCRLTKAGSSSSSQGRDA